jgi:ribosomal protein S18 acetylase RimI-like enzyme
MSPPRVQLRRAIASDLDAILALERATDHAPHWPPSAYAVILGPTDLGAPSIALGAPSIPRSLRNGWETTATSSSRIESVALLHASAIQRCLFVAEKNEKLAGFAVGLIHPATHDPANLKQSDDCSSKKQNCHSDPERREGEESPHLIASNRVAELESVVVSANARRAGIGRALCSAVLDWCRSHGATEVVLEVRSASAAAVALYAGLGFTPSARRPRYYRDPDDDALLLHLQLGGV